MSKKKFKDTKVGKFLNKVGNTLGDGLGDVLPDKGFLGVLRNLITADDTLPPQDKETALKLLEMDEMELLEVSKRWSSDMTSDSWLSKNTRPLTLMYLTFITSVLVVLDSTDSPFKVGIEWIELIKTLLVTVYVAYFGSRGYEKVRKISR
jgi:hypothetical protein